MVEETTSFLKNILLTIVYLNINLSVKNITGWIQGTANELKVVKLIEKPGQHFISS